MNRRSPPERTSLVRSRCADGLSGIRASKRQLNDEGELPTPSALSTLTRPPCASTAKRTPASPIPVPTITLARISGPIEAIEHMRHV